MTARPLAVFDLDGTLIDTAPDLADSCDHVLRSNGLPGIDIETLKPAIGFGARRMLVGAMEANGVRVDDAQLDAMFDEYLIHYASRISKLSEPFPEMLACLDRLDASDVAVAVCTNKREDLARKLLDELSLTPRLAAIVGGDTFGVAKPDPLPLLKTIELAGSSRDRTVFVGDSRVDRETAKRAQLPFVGVTYGYSDTPMEALEPDRLCRPGDDVAAAILDIMPVAAA